MDSKRRSEGEPSAARGDCRGCCIVVGKEGSYELSVGVEVGVQ